MLANFPVSGKCHKWCGEHFLIEIDFINNAIFMSNFKLKSGIDLTNSREISRSISTSWLIGNRRWRQSQPLSHSVNCLSRLHICWSIRDTRSSHGAVNWSEWVFFSLLADLDWFEEISLIFAPRQSMRVCITSRWCLKCTQIVLQAVLGHALSFMTVCSALQSSVNRNMARDSTKLR